MKREHNLIELHNVNFHYTGGTNAGGLTDINLTTPMVRLSFFVDNPAVARQH